MSSHSPQTSGLRVKEYNPDGPAQSKPIRSEEWNKHEARIRELHAAKYTRADVLEQLRADCGCAQNCSFSPSPSQYSAQLKLWGLRRNKTKGTMLTNSGSTTSDVLLQSRTGTTTSTLAQQVRPKADHGSKDRSSINRASSIIQEASDDIHSEQSPPTSPDAKSPWNAESVYPHFNSSETVQDAVRRVVHTLSGVLADSELDNFFNNLTDAELDELLVNDVKVKEARKDALAKHTGDFVRVNVGEFLGLRATRLSEIRDALERRAQCLYCSTPQVISISGGKSTEPLTNSSSDTSPATQSGDSTETGAVIHISDEDTEMQQYLEELELIDGMDEPKDLLKMSENEGISCSACVMMPSFDYNVSIYASTLWTEINSWQDRLTALDELGKLAGFLFAARSYEDAFDLYYIIWTESGPSLTDKLAAALNCARSSATLPQDLSVEAILHYHLRTYTKDAFSLRSPLDRLQETMVHSFLGDLYEKLEKKQNAEAHNGKAMLHLDEHKSFIETFFPQHSQILAALQSQIAKRQIHVSQAIGYNASTVYTDDIHKRLATKLQNNAILERLLDGCAMTINENSQSLNSFRSILPKNRTEQDGFIHRTLLCFLIEKWLNERERSSREKDTGTRTILRDLDQFGSPTEALSAIAMLIADDYPYQNKLHSTSGRKRSLGTLSLALLKNITKLKSDYRSFSEVYLALLAPSGEVRKQPLDSGSRTMLCRYMMNIASIGLTHGQHLSRGIVSQNTLVPSPDVFRELEIRPASLSNRLYSPRSSLNRSVNSIIATATEIMTKSVVKRQSVASTIVSYRSSWSFGRVTGLPRAPPGSSDWEMMDHEASTIQEEPQDEEMVDA